MNLPVGARVTAPADVDIVVTVYRDESSVRTLFNAIEAAVAPLGVRWRVIFVCDGSPDRSWDVVAGLAAERSNITAVELSRNFGQHIAVSAGLDFATAEMVVVMDSDLQDPPSAIPRMLSLLRDGNDVVLARRATRSGRLPRRIAAAVFWAILRSFVGPRLVTQQLMLRAMRQSYVRAFRSLREQHRFIAGLGAWLGFRQAVIEVEAPAGIRDGSTYRLRVLLTLALDATTAMTIVPLRAASILGCLVTIGSIAYGLGILLLVITGRELQPGFPTLAILVSVLAGVELLILGIIGEYVGRGLRESQRRPLYLVRQITGVGSDAATLPLPPHEPQAHRE